MEKLVGSWNVVGEAPGQDAFAVLLTFTSDGSVIANEQPGPFETTAQGSWVSTGPHEAGYTFLALFGSAESKLTSRAKVIGMLQYDVGTDTWRGPFRIEIVDPGGQQVFATRGTLSGVRIVVEPFD